MKVKSLLAAFLAYHACLLCVLAGNADFSVSFEPLKDAFASKEPVAVKMSLRNVSTRPLAVAVRHDPEFLGFEFSCKDERVTPRKRRGRGMPNFHAINKLLQPGESWDRVFALDRRLVFTQPGDYVISAESVHASTSERYGRAKYGNKDISATFRVRIAADELPKRYFSDLKDRLAQDQSKDKVAEIVEILHWTDNPSAIATIELAARKRPSVACAALRALEKFLPAQEAVLALEDILIAGDDVAVQVGLSIAAEKKVSLRRKTLERLALDRSALESKRYLTIEYLTKQKEPQRYRSIFEAATSDANKHVAALAQGALERMKGR